MVGRNEIDRIFGTDVYDSDGGKIGEAGQVYVDDETDEPEWVTVRTGLFGARESFVPLADAYFSEHGLTVPFDKTFIKNAPNQDVDGHLTPEEEQRPVRVLRLRRWRGGREPPGHRPGLRAR